MVGSVPLRSAEAVFDAIGTHLGDCVSRVPDGEQIGWVASIYAAFARNPNLEEIGKFPITSDPDGPVVSAYRLKTGKRASDLELGPYGIAENAISSYAAFRQLKGMGKLAPRTRLQVTFPGPLTSVTPINLPAAQLLQISGNALLDELHRILAVLPHEEIAIQFDLAAELYCEEYRRRPDNTINALIRNRDYEFRGTLGCVSRIANSVPAQVELGFHLCSLWHMHNSYGQDNDAHVAWANGLAGEIERCIDYIHVPVLPHHRESDFARLRELQLNPRTMLYLGLIHPDGLDACRARLAAATRVLGDFGVGFYCGLNGHYQGVSAQALGQVLDLHRDVARS
jgi:hypothetical protein